MKKITIFTVSMLDNIFLEDTPQKICLDSWYKLKDYIISLGFDCDIKIYRHNDPEVIAYKNECNFYVNTTKSVSRMSDGFRMYIMSKYPNHLWLDSDVWINDSIKFVDIETLTSDWWYIYNSDNTDTYKFVYDSFYKNAEALYQYQPDWVVNWMDMDVFKNYIHVSKNFDWLESIKCNLNLVHLAPLYNRMNKSHYFELTSYNDCYEITISTDDNSGKKAVQNQILRLPKNKELYDTLINLIKLKNYTFTAKEVSVNKIHSSKMYLDEFEIDVTDKCNLNCAGCNHFSPLTDEPFFYDLDTFEKDIKRMSELFMAHLIKLVGGEPFLHPKLLDLIKIVLKYFPDSNIRIYTNGILKNKIQELEEIIKINNYPVKIQISDYPVIDNSNTSLSKVNKNQFYFLALNPKGDSDIIATRSSCCNIRCYSLYNGRLYLCPLMRNLFKLNSIMKDSKFDISLNAMSMDIHKSNAQEIMLFLLDYDKAMQVCRYCSPHPKKVAWKKSERNANEWVNFN